jgi:hypothetical protein
MKHLPIAGFNLQTIQMELSTTRGKHEENFVAETPTSVLVIATGHQVATECTIPQLSSRDIVKSGEGSDSSRFKCSNM